MAESVRIGILGAGAIGTLLAALLERKGFSVTCVVKDDQVEELLKNGLILESPLFGSISAHPKVEAMLSEPVDVLFVTVKSPFLADSLQRIPNGMVSEGVVVSLLNGVGNVEVIRERLSARAVLGTIGAVEVEPMGLGHARHIGKLVPHIEMAGEGLDDIAAAIRSAGITVTIRDTEAEVLWGKLARLNALASITALSGKTVGEVRSDPALRARFDALVREGAAVAAKEGVNIDIAATVAFIDAQPAEMTTSMERDIQNGAPSELETITGGVLQKAKALGVATPVLEETFELLRKKVS